MNEICFVDHRRVFDINFNLKKLSISSDIPITTIKKLDHSRFLGNHSIFNRHDL